MNEANDNTSDYALSMSGAASSEISASPIHTFGEPELPDTAYELGGRTGKATGTGSTSGSGPGDSSNFAGDSNTGNSDTGDSDTGDPDTGNSRTGNPDTGNYYGIGNTDDGDSDDAGDESSEDGAGAATTGRTGGNAAVASVITLKEGLAQQASSGKDQRVGARREDPAAERSEIVAARGTAEGLILRLDGRVAADALKDAVADFLVSRKTFLSGNDVALEWVGAKPAAGLVEEISSRILKPYDIRVRSSRLREPTKVTAAAESAKGIPGSASERTSSDAAASTNVSEKRIGGLQSASAYALGRTSEAKFDNDTATSGRTLSIFDGIEALQGRGDRESREGTRDRKGGTASLVPPNAFGLDGSTAPDEVGKAFYERAYHERAVEERSRLANELNLWDDPDARVIYATLRSGQRVESEHSIIVFGDVNSGAEIISGGDIVVLGSLRGVAHAGAYDESGGGRVIFALKLQATQLRIGTIISRGEAGHQSVPELARVDGTVILVEPYQSRSLWGRR